MATPGDTSHWATMTALPTEPDRPAEGGSEASPGSSGTDSRSRTPGALALALAALTACSTAPSTFQPMPDLPPSVGDLAAADLPAALDLAVAADLAKGCPGPCADPTPTCDPESGACVPCLPAKDTCGDGGYCEAGDGGFACATGCKKDSECAGMAVPDGGAPMKMACCNHTCVNVQSAPDHCGKCGAACAQSCCSGACVDTAADAKHCGACGKGCGAGFNSQVACAQSKCQILACTAGFSDCNLDASDGCEINIKNDPANCTGCGKFCNPKNGVGGCANGCFIMSCYQGFAHCSNDVNDGCETSITKDPINCGVCGKVCAAPPNATAGCMGGVCNVGPCLNGFADCDNNPQNGCEATPLTDSKNCGKCGNACALPPNALPVCTAGSCSIGACDPNYLDCNKLYADGCEANVNGDIKNCGGCGKACPAYPNGGAACLKGACVLFSCNPGFLDCNQMPGDGCEIAAATDAKNCGGCNKACDLGEACKAGSCIINPGVQYSLAFVVNVTPVAQCTAWNTFRGLLIGNYTSVTISGSNDLTGVSCAGVEANKLCQALRTGTAVSTPCDGRIWTVGSCGSGISLSLDTMCSCNTTYTVRPCIGNPNWGGVKISACSAPSQTLTVNCQ